MKRSMNGSHAILARCGVLACALVLALAGCGNDADRAMQRAKAHRAKGDNASAAIEVKNALAAQPKNPALFLFAGQVMSDLGDLVNAEHSLRRALEYGHPAAEVLPLLGRVLLELEKYPEALEALKGDVKSDAATAPQVAALRGRAYLGQGAFTEARTEFRVSLGARPTAAAQLGLAQVAMAENDRATAARLVAEVLGAEPKNVDALMVQAEFLRLGGKLDDAASAYRQAIRLEPDNLAASVGLATLELARDRIDPAQPLLQRAEKLAPHSPRLRFAKALLAFKQKRNAAAIAELQQLALVMPRHAPGLLLAGMVQYADGKYDQAQNALGAYLQRFPADLAARRMLGATLLAKGQPHLAVNVFAPVIGSTQDVGVLAVAAEASRQSGRLNEARTLLQRAIGLAPNNADLLTNLALTDLASGARQRAMAGLEAAIALEPADGRADEALIMMLLGQKQIERAQKAASALERRLPKSSATYVLRGAVLQWKKDLSGARASLERALQIDAENLLAAEGLADLDAMENKPDSRRQRVEAILKTNGRHAGALLALARLDLAQGRHAEGVAAIRRAIAEHPQSINALLMLADAQYRSGQVAEAQISARQAHELHPYDTRAIAVLAEAQTAAGDKQGAILTLTKLTTLLPEAVSGYLRLAAAHLAAGDRQSAAATVQEALKKSPKDVGARAMLADIHLQMGELAKAHMIASQIQKEQPVAALGHRIEGDVLFARKDHARAADAFKKAFALQPGGVLLVRLHQAQSATSGGGASDAALRAWVAKNPADTETRFYLADILSHAGRYREAAEHFQEVLRRAPNSARALNNLAWALHAAGDRRALQYARQAVQLFPNSAPVVDTLGWILVQQGEVAEGVPVLLKAVSLDGNDPEIRYHLVQALLRIGDNGRARTELRTLLGSNKAFPQLAEARSLAARLGQ